MAIRHSPVIEALGFARALESASNHFARSAPDAPAKARRANLYALAATLRDATVLESPPASLRDPILPELRALPPQQSEDGDDEPFWQWMTIAALADQEGDFALAEEFVAAMMTWLRGQAPSATRDEWLAVCWTRRGRLSRQRGDVDNARDCYGEALRLVHGKNSRDAWAQAQLGLGVVYSLKGNLPEMERRFRRVVSHRPVTPAVYRVSAHQALTDACRRRGQLMDALLHGWQAYDLLDREDVRRFEVMNVLAQVALEADELDAAERGYRQVIASNGPERVVTPAAVGLVRILVRRLRGARAGSERMRTRHELGEVLAVARDVLERAVQPGERANLLLALADGHLALGDWTRAQSPLAAALELCTQHGFNKKAFRAEELLARLDVVRGRAASATSLADQVPDNAEELSRRVKAGRTHPAVLRLLQFDAS